MRAEAASQISVSENRGLTSALHPIAAVRVVGFRQAARDPKRPSLTGQRPAIQLLYLRYWQQRQSQTRLKAGTESHGSSLPPRRLPNDATKDPKTAELPLKLLAN